MGGGSGNRKSREKTRVSECSIFIIIFRNENYYHYYIFGSRKPSRHSKCIAVAYIILELFLECDTENA